MPDPSTLAFEPPSPGAWELMRTQFSRPMSAFMASVYPRAFMRGFRESTRMYGVLLDHYELVMINDFPYMAPRVVGAPKKPSSGPPPRFVFEIFRRVHPEVRRRIRRANEVFRDRTWRDDLRLWDSEVKPDTLARAKALLAEDVSALPDAELAAHIRRAADFLELTIYRTHRFNGCTMVPLGDFVAHVTTWTGREPSEVTRVLRGQSPVSVGSSDELAAARDAIRTAPEAVTLLASDRPASEIIDALLASPAPIGPSVRAYLDTVGLRILGGYDVADPSVREHPELVVRVLRAVVDGATGQTANASESAAEIDELRRRIPAEHRATFDELLTEAADTFRVRDERSFHGTALGLGIARRALLEAGRRLTAKGVIGAPEHLLEATAEDAARLLEGRGGPSAEQLAKRVAFRSEHAVDGAPFRLGSPPSTPPPADWLPPTAARLLRAVTAMQTLILGADASAKTDKPAADAPKFEPNGAGQTLKGMPVSAGIYEGLARVIKTPAELHTIRAGEILVTRTTGPTFNVVLPLIGAIVTERGGALSHAAIVSREYGMPGVVACAGATTAIATGARVRVDGGKGEVHILP